MTYQIHTWKFIALTLTSAAFGVCAAGAALAGQSVVLIVSGALCLVYLYISLFIVGAAVTIDSDGVRMHSLGITLRRYGWAEISEVGLAGLKLFNRKEKGRTGSVYIYFSPKAMNDEQRFDMCLSWPPKHAVFLAYSPKRLFEVQSRWGGEIVRYNAG